MSKRLPDHRLEWQGIARQASGRRVVLCDVFETVLLRLIHPEDIKRNVSARMCDLLGLEQGVERVYARRAAVERDLARRERTASEELEIRVRDVHRALLAEYRPRSPEDSDLLDELMRIEVECERTASVVDEAAVEALAAMRASGSRIAFVSDFYLPGEVLRPLLEEKGAVLPHDALYVSCDLTKSKRSGRLYTHVLAALEAAPADALMIGDNPHSDHAMAVRQGIEAVLLDRSALRAHYERCRGEHHAAGLAARIAAANAADPEQPFREVALALLLFVLELRNHARHNGFAHLAFMAREGQFLKRLFDRAEDVCAGAAGERIGTSYLYVSRRSTFMPSLQPLEAERFEVLFRQYVRISALDFLASLGFTREQSLDFCLRAGCDPDAEQAHFPSSDAMRALCASARFREGYESRRIQQRAALMAHLEGCGVMRPDTAVVDVGWKGTIQDNLARLLPGGVTGYYLGLVAPGAMDAGNRKHGMLFDFRRRFSGALFDETRSLFEVLLAADHGSVREYRVRGAEVEPVLEHNDEEHALYETRIEPIQAQLMVRFERLLGLWATGALTLRELRGQAIRLYRRLAYQPSGHEATLFAALTHYENFGVFRTTRFEPHRPGSVLEQISPLATYRYYRRVLIDAYWPSMQFKLAGRPVLLRLHALRRAMEANVR